MDVREDLNFFAKYVTGNVMQKIEHQYDNRTASSQRRQKRNFFTCYWTLQYRVYRKKY